MSRNIIYLINPISGTRKKAGLKDMITRRTKEQRIPFTILPTDPNGRYEQLKTLIQKNGVTDVVICGGDGTVSAVAAALMDMPVRIGIIPLGSGNGLALSARIPSSPGRALDIIFAGRASAVDGMFINNHFSCMLCGIGFDAQVAHDFAKERRRGLQTYIKVSAINFFKATPYPFQVERKGKKISTEAFFICIANSNQFGNNFTIAPRASLRDGLLDVVIVKKMNKIMLPFSIMGQVTGTNLPRDLNDYTDRNHVIYFQTSELVIHNPALAPMHIDGDPADSAEIFNVRVVKNAFQLLQPS